jgi:hypothetical protein
VNKELVASTLFGTNANVYSNAFISYTPSIFVTTNFVTQSHSAPNYTNLVSSQTVFNNLGVTNWSQVVVTNWTLVTNGPPIYGADIADLPIALAAYNLAYNGTNTTNQTGPLYDRDSDSGEYLWAFQYETNFTINLIVQTITNLTPASYTNYLVGTRSATNSWHKIDGTISGSITAGKLKKALKNAAGLYEESHLLYTPVTTAPGEASYYIQEFDANLDVVKKTELEAEVVQYGKTFQTASPGPDTEDAYQGTGSLTTAKNGQTTYKATLKGVGLTKPGSLALNGTTRNLITGYTQITNAPTVLGSGLVNITNFATTPPFVLSITNATSGYLVYNANSIFTNVVGNVTTLVSYDFGGDIYVTNYTFQTNYASNAIGSVTMNGKIMGQTLVKNAFVGVNPDQDEKYYIQEVFPPTTNAPYVIVTYPYGWPISSNAPFAPGPNADF